MKYLSGLIINFIFVSTLLSQTNVATTSASFLEIGSGAKSLSMGGAFVSVANDVSALYWNTASIVNIDRPSVQFYHSPWLVETEYYYGGVVIPLSSADAIGFSYTSIGMDEMMVRTVDMPEGTGEKFDAIIFHSSLMSICIVLALVWGSSIFFIFLVNKRIGC